MDRPGPVTRPLESWTEPSTAALIESWGDRFVRLNRGILRREDWKEISAAVNEARRVNGGDQSLTPLTDVQCRNRVDTLKKRYKLEKSKLPSPSSWIFYRRLDFLLGAAGPSPPPNAASAEGKGKRRRKATAAVVIDVDDDEEDDADDDDRDCDSVLRKVEVGDEEEEEGAAAFRGLAGAVARLAEIYERTERARMRTVVELERQRMEFSKEIEAQRLNVFVDAQVELAKSHHHRPKRRGGGGGGTASSGKK